MHASRQSAIRKQDELWVICLIMQGLHIWQIMRKIMHTHDHVIPPSLANID